MKNLDYNTRIFIPSVKRIKKLPLNIPKLPKIFIPEIGVFGNFEVPSTPFRIEKKEPIFIGDILELKFTKPNGQIENIEYYMVDLVNGQYMAIFNNSKADDVLLATILIGNKKNIKVIGNAFSEPILRLKLLTQ